MNTDTSPAPIGVPFPSDRSVLRGWAERLASVDMWPEAARLSLAGMSGQPSDEERLNIAWACVRGGQPHQARTLLEPLKTDAAPLMALREAASTLCDVPEAYERFLQYVIGVGNNPTALRLIAMCASHQGDWGRAGDAARRMLVHAPQDAEMLGLVAADLAVEGDWQGALVTVERARSDRFSCQSDPAKDLTDLLLARQADEQAVVFAALAYANTARPGWRTQLDRLVPVGGELETLLPREVLAAVRAARTVNEGEPVTLSQTPALLAAASSVLNFAAETATSALSTATGLIPGARSVWSWVLTRHTDVTGTVLRSLALSDKASVYDPARCSCWETDWYSGPEARQYVDEHLESVTVSESLGLVVRRCPSLDKTWLDLPGSGFTVTIEDPAAGANAKTAAADEPKKDDGHRVGFYL